MKVLALLLLVCLPTWALTCTQGQVVVDPITGQQAKSHSTVEVSWTVTDTATDFQRVQYGPTTSYGLGWIGTEQQQHAPTSGVIVVNMTGLQPSTTYHILAQSSTDNVTWCTGIDQTITTATLPTGGHPIYPTAPTNFDANTVVTPTGKVWLLSPLTCTGVYPSGFTSATYGGSSCHDNTSDPGLADTLQHIIGTTSGLLGTACNATYGDVIILQKNTVAATPQEAFPNTLTLADACDMTGKINSIDSTGLFTTVAAHGMSAGTTVRFGGNNVFGGSSASFAPPFQAGFPYCVLASGLAATTFRIGTTCGGSIVSNGATNAPGYNFGCFISGNGYQSEKEIIIRTSALDSQLPPQGVRIDSSYDSQLATIRNSTPLPSNTSNAVSFSQGCLAHHYRWLGIKWDYAAVSSIGAVDGYYYAGFLTSDYSNSYITLDRNHVAGADYPERDVKFWVFMEGAYMAVVNSLIENMNAWTPSNTYQQGFTSANAASGTAVQVMTGKLYKGQNVASSCSNHPTFTRTGGTTGVVVWEIASDCTNFVTAQTGLTITCLDSSGASCTVTTTASPVYLCSPSPPCNGQNLYTRYPIATMTVSGGNWTGMSWQSENSMATGGNLTPGNGGVALSVNYGPGPTKLDNNTISNGIGILLYWTGDNSQILTLSCLTPGGNVGCTYLTPPSDVTLTRNSVITDIQHLPNPANASWNGRFYSGRQPGEFKEVHRAKVVGNDFSGSFCVNSSIHGPIYDISPLNDVAFNYASTQTVVDMEFGWNTFRNACLGMQILGAFPGVGQIDFASQRFWLHDMIFTNINKNQWVAIDSVNSGSGNGEQLALLHGSSDLLIEHNFFDIPQSNLFPEVFTGSCHPNEGVVVRNNLFGFSNDNNTSGAGYFPCSSVPESPNTGQQFGAAALNNHWVNFTWKNNWLLFGYKCSSSATGALPVACTPQADASHSDVTTAVTNWNTLASTNFVDAVSANTIVARTALMKLRNYSGATFSPFNFQPLPTSNFSSGGDCQAGAAPMPDAGCGTTRGMDGLQIGPDIDGIVSHQGTVLNTHTRAIGSTTATVDFYAPDTTGCTVDWTTSSTYDPTTLTRVANAGGARPQSVNLTSLTTKTLYYYRVNCQAQQPTGTFITR